MLPHMQEERDLSELVNPARIASQEYEVSVKITGPLVRQIVEQAPQAARWDGK